MASIPAGGGTATAAGDNCGTRGSYLDVVESPYQASVYGVRADIETNDPALCSAAGGSPSLSTAWAMLTPDQPHHWAQAGYIRVGADYTSFPGPTGFHYVAQFTNECRPGCDDVTTVVTSTDPGTETHRFASYLRASDDRIHMTRDGNNLLTMDYDVTGEWVNEWAGQFGGETQHTASDVPGTNGDQTRFNYIQRYEANGDINFIQTLNLIGSPPNRYHRQVGDAAVGGRYLDIWTDPL